MGDRCGASSMRTCGSTRSSPLELLTRRCGKTYRFRSSAAPDRYQNRAEANNSYKRARMKTRLLFAAAGLIAVNLPAQGRVQRPMTFEDFAAVKNVGDPQVSPNGAWVLYSRRTTDVNANKRTTVTVLAPVGGNTIKDAGANSGLRAGQFPNATTQASEARWSP